MITNKEVEELYEQNLVKKFVDGDRTFYYFDKIRPTRENIYDRNRIHVGLSEWWEVYNSREFALRYDTGNLNAIPIITSEECMEMGL